MITIKGLRKGLLIVFSPENEPWLARLRELKGRFIANEAFFGGGQIAFDVGSLFLSADDVQRSLALLAEYQIQLVAILTDNDATRASAASFGIPDAIPAPPVTPKEAPTRTASADDVTEEVATNSAFFKGKLRSGQTVKHPGHVIVIGDVNPGGQILAGGDIIVWGRLQGSAHAGAFGDVGAIVCALEMTPTLLRIADAAVRNHKGKTEIARVEEQQVVFSTWDKS